MGGAGRVGERVGIGDEGGGRWPGEGDGWGEGKVPSVSGGDAGE